MDGEHVSGDPSRLRIADADRHRVAELLREAAGEGRLDLEELDERLEATWAAKTYADLVPIVADLPGGTAAAGATVPLVHREGLPRPGGPGPPGAVPVRATRFDTSLAIMGGQDRKGVWELGESHTAVALMGGIVLDLRAARFTAVETVLWLHAVMGSVDVVVNAWTDVSVEGVGIMGAFDQGRDRVAPQVGPGSPLVRVKGVALMGSATVTRKPMPGEPRRRRLPR